MVTQDRTVITFAARHILVVSSILVWSWFGSTGFGFDLRFHFAATCGEAKGILAKPVQNRTRQSVDTAMCLSIYHFFIL